MEMPGRKWTHQDYRYAMNTQEKTPEIFDGSYIAKFWEYDSRIGRRWNMDPKPTKGVSDYACFLNNPIFFSDPLGDKVTYEKGLKGLKERIQVGFARLVSKEFRKQYKILDEKKDIYMYKNSDKKDIGPSNGNVKMVKVNYKNGNVTNNEEDVENREFEIRYKFKTQDQEDTRGQGKYHVLFEETYHAASYASGRNSPGLTSKGQTKSGDSQTEEAEAWQFAARNAPFQPKHVSILRQVGDQVVTLRVTNTLVNQVKNSNLQGTKDLLFTKYDVTGSTEDGKILQSSSVEGPYFRNNTD